MYIHEFVDEGLGHSSYLVEIGETALVVDPPRFPTELEALALQLHVQIDWTADTHSHADYVTGSPALAARTHATFLAPAASRLESPHQPLADGDEVDLGMSYSLRALATPGHTPDHMAYLLCDRDGPAALFSGGSLMVGTIGRTDLLGPEQAEPLAREMYWSLQNQILSLPDDLPVYPTHGAGSFCSAPGATERTTTIGEEKHRNPILRINDEDSFVNELLSGFGTFPTYFARLPGLNRRGPRQYDELPELERVDIDTFTMALRDGAVIVDARPITAFATGHIPGSLSNALRPSFASWLGWIVAPYRPLLFILNKDQPRTELIRQCLDVGYEHLVGELAGGIAAWRAHGNTLATIELVDPDTAAGTVIDVRQAGEYISGHIPKAQNVELGMIAETPIRQGPLTVACGHGERAMTAASLLAQKHCEDVRVLTGGPEEWPAATGQILVVGP
ncbi:MAG: rhodanese-like domain-containing protein [Acidimicrobiales bacterium]